MSEAFQIALVLGLLIVALLLFLKDAVSVDVVALGAVLILTATRILTPEQAFSSFGSEMMVLLASIFVIAGALLKTGVFDSIGLYLYRHAGGNSSMLLGSIMLVVAVASAFANNTVVTAVFVPPVVAVARRSKIPPSKLLIPVAFASMLGGSCTLIGTSTNVAASAFLARRGMQPFGLFEFLPVGVFLVLGGILYFILLGDRLLPARGKDELTETYHVKEYLTEVALRRGCPYLGKRLDESGLQEAAGVTVLGIVRKGQTLLAPEGHEILAPDDRLLLEGSVEGIQRLRLSPGVEMKGDSRLGDRNLESDRIKLVEVMVGPASRFIDRSLQEVDFRRRFGMTALAIARQGEDLIDKVGKVKLKVGDVLLVQGPEQRLDDLRAGANVLIMSDVSHILHGGRKGMLVVAFFLGALVLGALEILPLGAAALGAAVLTVLVRAIPREEVYSMIDWRLLVLIGGMTAFGQAMVVTRTDEFLSTLVVKLLGGLGPYGILAGFFSLTVALSQPLSNAAAALTVLPVALSTAEAIGANPRAFAVTVTLAASASFITPLEPSCLLVYPAGHYRFSDFVKVGWPLTVLVMILVMSLVPALWKM